MYYSEFGCDNIFVFHMSSLRHFDLRSDAQPVQSFNDQLGQYTKSLILNKTHIRLWRVKKNDKLCVSVRGMDAGGSTVVETKMFVDKLVW